MTVLSALPYPCGRRLAALLCHSAMFIVASCSPSSSTERVQPQTVDAVEVYQAPQSLFRHLVRELVMDSVRWGAIWDSTGGRTGLDLPEPQVDFSRFSVLVAAGPALGAGDSIVIDSIGVFRDVVRARVTAYTMCLPPQVSPVPVHMVRIRKAARELSVVERRVIGPNCVP
jgi:hypothetical protein